MLFNKKLVVSAFTLALLLVSCRKFSGDLFKLSATRFYKTIAAGLLLQYPSKLFCLQAHIKQEHSARRK
jgi:hypothetical protein